MMNIVKRIKCNKCDNIIEPREGVIVQGNIYIVNEDINDRAGVVGNNLPIPDIDGKLSDNWEIHEVAYHINCLNEIIQPK